MEIKHLRKIGSPECLMAKVANSRKNGSGIRGAQQMAMIQTFDNRNDVLLSAWLIMSPVERSYPDPTLKRRAACSLASCWN